MYVPPQFREDRVEVNQEFMRSHPLGLLVSFGGWGLEADSVPFVLYAEEGEFGTLRAHVARANPHWKQLAGGAECLVVFQGPQAYVTPSWYATKQETQKVVPTWNYVSVHVWGKPRVVEDAAWIRRQLEDLTSAQECQRPKPWRVDDAPADYIAAQIQAIIGIEIPISHLEGKWKVSQNRPEADRRGVIAGLRSQGEAGQAMAALVAERLP